MDINVDIYNELSRDIHHCTSDGSREPGGA